MTNWKKINLNFTGELQKKWEEKGFSYEECKKWINAGLKVDDFNYALWLKSEVKTSPEEIFEGLRGQYQEYLESRNENNSQENLTAQDWLENNYPNNKEVEEIDLTYLTSLRESELVINDFPNLKEIKKLDRRFGSSEHIYKISKVTISNCPKLEKVNIRFLKDNKELILINIPTLKELDCFFNQLSELNIRELSNLKQLNCGKNKLTKIDLPENNQLEMLNISNNNFPEQDLFFLGHLTNLKQLLIGGWDEEGRIKEGIFNRFIGSLKPLQNFNKLEILEISNTDIEEGIEYLPVTIKTIMCSAIKRPESKVTRIDSLLKEDDFFAFREIRNKHYENLYMSWYAKKHNAQEWLDKNYSTEKRGEITELDISSNSDKNLEGKLDLKDFTNLQKLNCENNYLTNLDLSNCKNLQLLKVSFNGLSNIDFLNSLPSPERLKVLHLSGNSIYNDLTPFSHFTNLEELDLGSYGNYSYHGESSEREKLMLNKFYGSLKPLQKLKQLKKLNISNSDIDSGVEYLPESLEEIYCSNKERLESKVKEIEKELANEESYFFYESDRYIRGCNAQEWLDKSYPNKQRRNQERVLTINEKKIKGNLDLKDFVNLEYFECNGNFLISLDISYSLELKKFHCNNNQLTSLDVSKNQKLVRLDCSKNKIKELDLNNNAWLTQLYCSSNQLSGLDLSKNNNLVAIDCKNNILTKIEFGDCSELESINCQNNQLKELNIGDSNKLKNIHCENNQLTSLSISPQVKSQLEWLYATNNHFSPQGLSFFSDFINLRRLDLGIDKGIEGWEESKKEYNKFYGSLEPLKNLTKLEWLCIPNTDIDSGLEYLPGKVEEVLLSTDVRSDAYCRLIKERLEEYKKSSDYLDLVKDISKEEKIRMVIDIPPQFSLFLHMNLENIEEVYSVINRQKEIAYDEVYPQKSPPFKINGDKSLPLAKLPIKLYNIEEDKVNWVKNSYDIKNYATLSYVWGKPGIVGKNFKWDTWYKDKLNPTGYKSFYKAVQACKLLKINYLWMDQLCIDQENLEEKNQEVPKMGQYYGNAAVTLIPINYSIKDITKKGDYSKSNFFSNVVISIINSQWFQRSWTFQEGCLSKQTIFMFDNILIDGRFMAVFWGNFEWMGNSFGKNFDSFFETHCTKKIATPLGWAYYREGYSLEDKVSLSLSEALQATKSKGRSIPTDGIYSILGLLPYGEKVGVNYSISATEALSNVMKTAVENGYGEPLSWQGIGNEIPGLCWLPQIDSKGSTNIEGVLGIRCKPNGINFLPKGIEVNGSEYVIVADKSAIKSDDSETVLIWRMYLDNTGDSTVRLMRDNLKIHSKSVLVKIGNNYEKLTLWGKYEILETAKVGNTILVLNKDQWESNIPFAILTSSNKNDTYHRVNLVNLLLEPLVSAEKKLVIGADDKQKISEAKMQSLTLQIRQNQQQIQSQIQQPPK